MITYVNTVLVNNDVKGVESNYEAVAAKTKELAVADAGKFVIDTVNEEKGEFKIGLITDQATPLRTQDKQLLYLPVIRWSNVINKNALKHYEVTKYTEDSETEDQVTICLNELAEPAATVLAMGNKRVVVRITYKDLPTKHRKWTETYEYITQHGDGAEEIAKGIAWVINSQYKRARVIAEVKNGTDVVITGMPYDDDNVQDSLSWAAKVRFNVNMYYTDPAGEGFTANNKYYLDGVTITKVPGKWYPATGKLVRDRESQSFGYMGILNRGECTWPIIKPAMTADININYDAITLEFENMYRTADNWLKNTKQAVEIYVPAGNIDAIDAEIKKALGL